MTDNDDDDDDDDAGAADEDDDCGDLLKMTMLMLSERPILTSRLLSQVSGSTCKLSSLINESHPSTSSSHNQR